MASYRNNNIKDTGRYYGNDGVYFTITTRDRDDNLVQAGPFVRTNSFPKTITLKMFKYFLGDKADNWIKLFGEDIIKKHLKLISPWNFLTTDFYEDKGTYGGLANILTIHRAWLYGGYTTYPCVEWKGEWKREYTGHGYKYIHQSPYSTWEKPFMEACLKSKFPYLACFNFDAYGFHMSKDTNELYIHCDVDRKNVRSLYVPFKALIENDFEYVTKRMSSYFGWYYNKFDQKEYLDAALSLLDSPEAMKLKECFAKEKEKEK